MGLYDKIFKPKKLVLANGKVVEEEQTIVAFSVFGGYRSEEIAEMLGKNPGTVRSRKSRAFGKMREMLD